jgi:hypothetical protein
MFPFWNVGSASGLVFLVLSANVVFAGNLKVGKYPKIYSGDEGIKVTVISIEDSEPKSALVHVVGAESRIDDVVLLYKEVPNGSNGYGLETYIDDDTFWTVRSENHRYGGKEMLLTLPEARTKTISLYYNEKLSKDAKGDDILKKYESQLANGTIAKVQIYKGSEDIQGRANGVFKRAVNEAKTDCKAPIGAKIDWASISADVKAKRPVATLCRQAAEILAAYCAKNAEHSVAKKVEQIHCSFGAKQDLSLGKDKRLMWQVPSSKEPDLEVLKKQIEQSVKS